MSAASFIHLAHIVASLGFRCSRHPTSRCQSLFPVPHRHPRIVPSSTLHHRPHINIERQQILRRLPTRNRYEWWVGGLRMCWSLIPLFLSCGYPARCERHDGLELLKFYPVAPFLLRLIKRLVRASHNSIRRLVRVLLAIKRGNPATYSDEYTAFWRCHG